MARRRLDKDVGELPVIGREQLGAVEAVPVQDPAGEQ
jgi:hypothetical protein